MSLAFNKGRARLITPAWSAGELGKIELIGGTIEQHAIPVDIGLGSAVFYMPGPFSWFGTITTGHYLERASSKTRWLIVEDDTDTWQAMGKVQLTGHNLPGKFEPYIFDFEGVGELYLDRAQLQLPI